MAQNYSPIDQDASLALAAAQITDNFEALRSNSSGSAFEDDVVAGQLVHLVATIGHADLTEAGNGVAQAITLGTLPANSVVLCSRQKSSTAFSGGGISTLTASLGWSGSATAYGSAYNLLAAVADTNQQVNGTGLGPTAASHAVLLTVTPDGGHNLADLTAGEHHVEILAVVMRA